LRDPEIAGINIFRDRFGDAAKELDRRNTECGPFEFAFYIFDLVSRALAWYFLKLTCQRRSQVE
jgi:hypothetical protein